MRIFMLTDLEGVAGNTTFLTDTYPNTIYYEHAKRRLTAEINAAVDGLLSEGVDEVIVLDAHGPGGVDFDTLHPRAELIHGRPLPPRRAYDHIIESCAATVIIGQHAMAGVANGNMNHTQSSLSIEGYFLNGEEIGEIAQFALYTGAVGIPLIFVSGDRAACDEAEALIPGITTASVKDGLGRTSALTVSAQEAHRIIREGAAEAIRQHAIQPIAPLVWEPPFILDKRYFTTTDADTEESTKTNAERLDDRTIRYTGENIRTIIYQ